MAKQKLYRVFLVRSYLASDFLEVMATTPRRAEAMARQTMRRLRPDARAEATDNGWIPEPAVELTNLGQCGLRGEGRLPMEQISKNVYKSRV